MFDEFKSNLMDFLANPGDKNKRQALIDAVLLIHKTPNPTKYAYYQYIQSNLIEVLYDVQLNAAQQRSLFSVINDHQLWERGARKPSDILRAAHIIFTENKNRDLSAQCLINIVQDLLDMQKKLEDEDNIVRSKNFHQSFFPFFKNSDVNAITAKKYVIEALCESLLKSIVNNFPLKLAREQKINFAKEVISTLEYEEINLILKTFIDTQVRPILEKPPGTTTIYSDNRMKTAPLEAKHRALQLFSYGVKDSWFTIFLTNMVNKVCQILGIKTDAEKLLESTEQKVAQLGIKIR